MEDGQMRLRIDWQEDEAELYRLYRQERNGQRKTRLQALWLLRQGKTLQQASQVLGLSSRNLYRWLDWYRQGGLSQVLSRQHGGDHGEKGFLNNEQKEALIAQAEQQGFATAHEAGGWMEKELGVHYAPDSVWFVLVRLGLKKKVPRPRSLKTSPQAQAAWKKGGSLRPSGLTR
jgi:putative transposase